MKLFLSSILSRSASFLFPILHISKSSFSSLFVDVTITSKYSFDFSQIWYQSSSLITALLRALWFRPPKILSSSLFLFYVSYIFFVFFILFVLYNNWVVLYSSCFRTQMADENNDRSESPNPSQNKNLFKVRILFTISCTCIPVKILSHPLCLSFLESLTNFSFTNYHSWSRSVLTTLSAKNKVEFVNGVAPLPAETDSSFSSWIRCNNMVASWLVHSVSVNIRQRFIWMDKALDIWNDLKAYFSQGEWKLLHSIKVTFMLPITLLNWGLSRMN